MNNKNTREPLEDSGATFSTVSYQTQYIHRYQDDVLPFQGVDADIVINANLLEDNASVQANRRFQPSGDEVER